MEIKKSIVKANVSISWRTQSIAAAAPLGTDFRLMNETNANQR